MVKKIATLLILAAMLLSISGCGTFLFERRDDADEFERRWAGGCQSSNPTLGRPGSCGFKSDAKQTRLFGWTKGDNVHWLWGKID